MNYQYYNWIKNKNTYYYQKYYYFYRSFLLFYSFSFPHNILIIITVISLSSSFGDRQNDDYVGSRICISWHNGLYLECVKRWQSSIRHTTMKLVSRNKDILGNLKINTSLKKTFLRLSVMKLGYYVIIGTDFNVFASESCTTEESEAPHNLIDIERR